MVTTILSDFSGVILRSKERNYSGTLNARNKELSAKNPAYSFSDYFEFNTELLDLYRRLKPKYFLNIFTTGTIQNRPEVKKIIGPIFENVFSANEYGLNKKDPAAYLFIAGKLNKKPAEIIYIDDQESNTLAAQKAGLKVIYYIGFQETIKQLKSYL